MAGSSDSDVRDSGHGGRPVGWLIQYGNYSEVVLTVGVRVVVGKGVCVCRCQGSTR